MTMNKYERAVVDAARAVSDASVSEGFESMARALSRTQHAVAALDEHQRAQDAAGIRQIEWALVVAGDELQGGSGAFYAVLKVKQEYVMGKYTGKRIITVQLKTGPKDLVRPHGAEPFATVRRSRDGAVVDEFVNVFSSGEM